MVYGLVKAVDRIVEPKALVGEPRHDLGLD
jgi:hypothetical protein